MTDSGLRIYELRCFDDDDDDDDDDMAYTL